MLSDTVPMSAPLTVRLPCPPPGKFAPPYPVPSTPSKLTTSDTVPTPDPAVTTAPTLPPDPDPTLHLTELSDTHPVPSHPVPPVPPPTLYDPVPRLPPLTVRLPCPVVPWFTTPAPHPRPAGTSYDPPPVIVLDRIPAVTYVARLPPAPPPPPHLTELSDTQSVASHCVPPS